MGVSGSIFLFLGCVRCPKGSEVLYSNILGGWGGMCGTKKESL